MTRRRRRALGSRGRSRRPLRRHLGHDRRRPLRSLSPNRGSLRRRLGRRLGRPLLLLHGHRWPLRHLSWHHRRSRPLSCLLRSVLLSKTRASDKVHLHLTLLLRVEGEEHLLRLLMGDRDWGRLASGCGLGSHGLVVRCAKERNELRDRDRSNGRPSGWRSTNRRSPWGSTRCDCLMNRRCGNRYWDGRRLLRQNSYRLRVGWRHRGCSHECRRLEDRSRRSVDH